MAQRRSSFFFLGRFDPAELANFNVQNVFLRDRRGGVVELLGHGIAVWWPSYPRDGAHFDTLRDAAGLWLALIAAAHYLESGIALEPRLVGWVEALDVRTKETVIGITDERFHKVAVIEESDTRNQAMRNAIQVARRLHRSPGELQRAATELLAAANDPSDQAFLSAFRALECVRRIYEPSFEKRKEGWQKMATDLGVKSTKHSRILAKAAEAIRHGDLPNDRLLPHPVNEARAARLDILEEARGHIAAAVTRHA